MDRREKLLSGITPAQRGIEVAPWFNPLAPKREGYDVLVLDVFDVERLRENARVDPNIPKHMVPNIEPVDLVGSAVDLADLVETQAPPPKTFDYILSSHNFEHLPDPVRFLQGCERVLNPGGVISMAIPDRRACFDFFRPVSVTADVLEAYVNKAERPTYKQIFTQQSLASRLVKPDGTELHSFSLGEDPEPVRVGEGLREAWAQWQELQRTGDSAYHDTHCWAFTPSSFEVIVRDLRFLGLIRLVPRFVTPNNGNEFYVQLEFQPDRPDEAPSAFYAQRNELLHKVTEEAGVHTRAAFRAMREAGSGMSAEAANSQLASALQRVRDLETSTSWRMTAPLRALARRIGKG